MFSPTPGKKTIYCTTLETTSPPDGAVGMFNSCAAIVVPSKWNADSLAACGVKVPIRVVPESLHPVFKFSPRPPGDVFSFGAAGVGKRKNLQAVIDAFLAMFPINGSGVPKKNVRLLIRTSAGHGLRTNGDKRIFISSKVLSPEDLLRWYSILDVFVSASHGEAWGRHLHEAMMVGRPCITPLHGGPAEFLGANTAYIVPHTVVPAGLNYTGLGEWCNPSTKGIAVAMRAAVEDTGMAERQILANAAAKKFTRAHAADLLSDVLLEVGAAKMKKQPDRIVHAGYGYHTLSSCPDRDLILRHWGQFRPMPKMPVPDWVRDAALSNTPHGIGDITILTAVHRAGASVGRHIPIQSSSPVFADIVRFVPGSPRAMKRNMKIAMADRMQAACDMGNGHFIQRLQRAFGLVPDVKPKPGLVVDGVERVKGRCALHFVPGKHAEWQSRVFHPNARQIAPEAQKSIREFIGFHKNDMEFVEIGAKETGIAGPGVRFLGGTLPDTIRFLASCEYFIGIVSGPMHLAAAMGCKSIIILNFPRADRIILPALKDIPLVENEWLYPQNVHLHQEEQGPLVPMLSPASLELALNGKVYPYWKDDCLDLVNE
jgi:hypothetical protein